MEHEMNDCSSHPRVRCATLGFDVQRLRRIESARAKEPTATKGNLLE